MDKGLICCYLLDGEGGGRQLDWAGLRDWKPQDGVLWVHMDRTVQEARRWLRQDSGLDPAIVSTLLANETRPRSASMQDGLLVLLRGVNLNPGQEPEDMVSVRAWFSPRRVITFRRRRLVAIDDMRRRFAEGTGPGNAGDLLCQLSELMVDKMEPVMEAIADELSSLETEMEDAAESPFRRPKQRPRVAELQRETIMIRRHLEPQYEALANFERQDFGFLEPVQRMQLVETADRVQRYVEDLEFEQQRAAVLHDQITDRLAEAMNRTMYLLSLIATIFLPLGFITQLYEAFVASAPAGERIVEYEVLVAALALLTVVVAILFRRLRWL